MKDDEGEQKTDNQTRLLICENCRHPRPGMDDVNGKMIPVGESPCSICGEEKFTPVSLSDTQLDQG